MSDILLFIIVGAVGVVLGRRFALRRQCLVAEQSKKKQENKEKILDFLNQKGKIQNNDVEELVGVSDATAERYLDELEKEGKISQHGEVGQGVFYTLN